MGRCFVVMGYGKRPDPETSKVYDLDKSYRSVIEQGVRLAGLDPIRADEVVESGVISRQMYRDFMDAELVVCDLTTLNPNALYELGVRMALRPRSTIVIAAEGTKVPFNLNQNRFFWYKHSGQVIDYDGAIAAQQQLVKVCAATLASNEPDSLIYSIFGDQLVPPHWKDPTPEPLKAGANSSLIKASHSMRIFVEEAKQRNAWDELARTLQVFHEDADREGRTVDDWYTQQCALATYKRSDGNGANTDDLLLARDIIDRLHPSVSTDRRRRVPHRPCIRGYDSSLARD